MKKSKRSGPARWAISTPWSVMYTVYWYMTQLYPEIFNCPQLPPHYGD